MQKKIKAIIQNIPAFPGIYIMKSADGTPIYIGKAKSLKNRVSSYFQESAAHAPKTMFMVDQIRDIDFIVTKTEIEALILESNFIKKHQPKYNVLLKDDKHYPYLRLSTNESFPRLEIVRKVRKNGGTYFGPYAMAGEIRKTLRFIYKIFPLRQSKDQLDGSKKRRPCLNYQMGHCLGPCAGLVSKEDYGKIVKEIIFFLKGRNKDLVEYLKKEMTNASEKLDFEKAARVRDQINAIQNVAKQRPLISPNQTDMDILGYFMENRTARVQILSVRGGEMLTQRSYPLRYRDEENGKEILNAFIKQYYGNTVFIPPEIIIGEAIPDKDLLEKWLTEKKEKMVSISVPVKGKKRLLANMAEENAKSAFYKTVDNQEKKKNALMEIQRSFSLKKLPEHIEAFDISNTFGASAVGAVVSYKNGEPDKSGYRRFSIKEVEGIDDYAMMEETLTRHYGKIREEKGVFPDLVLIDGGKGHLNRSVAVLKKLKIENMELISIAKGSKRNQPETDEIYRPGHTSPISTPPNHSGRKLLQAIRDEVHRFSITAHRKLRQKKARHSLLEEIRGIGPKRKIALMKHFKGLEAMKKAGIEELKTVPGMTEILARTVKETLFKGK